MPNNISLALVKQAFLEYYHSLHMMIDDKRAEENWKIFKDKLQVILREQARKAADRKAGTIKHETK